MFFISYYPYMIYHSDIDTNIFLTFIMQTPVSVSLQCQGKQQVISVRTLLQTVPSIRICKIEQRKKPEGVKYTVPVDFKDIT